MEELVSGIPEISNLQIESSLANGLKRLENSKYDLIFLDLSLPDSFGIETIKSVYSSFSNIPIIVFTGVKDEENGIKLIFFSLFNLYFINHIFKSFQQPNFHRMRHSSHRF